MAHDGIRSQIDFLPSRLATRYSAEIDHEAILRLSQREIWERIIADASKQLAQRFIETHGDSILVAISHHDVAQKVVEEVVKRMLNTIKEK